MLAARLARFGEPLAVLRLEKIPDPEAGRGQVLVRLTARPINPSDLLTIRGRYGSLPQLPATPGWEGAGVVESVGEGVSGVRLGQRVIPLSASGTWQEYLAVDAANLVSVPDEVDDALASQAFLNPIASWAMLQDVLKAKPGEWLIQNAAASALGQVVIQLAREMGLKTINVVRRESQKAELLALGATEVIPADDLVERVREVTPEGPRYALDAVGGKQGWELLRTLRAGGMIVLHGSLAHPETMPLNNGLVLTRSLTIRGFWLTEWRRRASRRKQKEIVTTILGLMANGALILPSVRTFPLSAVVEAVAASEQGEGKVILTS